MDAGLVLGCLTESISDHWQHLLVHAFMPEYVIRSLEIVNIAIANVGMRLAQKLRALGKGAAVRQSGFVTEEDGLRLVLRRHLGNLGAKVQILSSLDSARGLGLLHWRLLAKREAAALD